MRLHGARSLHGGDVATPDVGPARNVVLGVVRGGQVVRVDAPEVDALEPGDRLLYIRSGDDER